MSQSGPFDTKAPPIGAMHAGLGGGLNIGWIGGSPIDTLVQRACEPSLGEPPYNLHIELAEYISNKKANT
jgi:ADP-ribosylation factor-binding protein GGA